MEGTCRTKGQQKSALFQENDMVQSRGQFALELVGMSAAQFKGSAASLSGASYDSVFQLHTKDSELFATPFGFFCLFCFGSYLLQEMTVTRKENNSLTISFGRIEDNSESLV